MQQTTPDDAAREAGRRLKAIGLMVIALVLFSGLDASAKYLATAKGLPVTQIVWVRFVVQFVLLLVFVPAFGLLARSSACSRPRACPSSSFVPC